MATSMKIIQGTSTLYISGEGTVYSSRTGDEEHAMINVKMETEGDTIDIEIKIGNLVNTLEFDEDGTKALVAKLNSFLEDKQILQS